MAPAQYPGCSGTRNLHDNLSDLRAQVAANQRGSQLVGELIDSYGLAVVQAYMGYIQVTSKEEEQKFVLSTVAAFVLMLQSNAELAVRDMLREFSCRRRQQTGSLDVESEDFMDDGTPIRLRVQINEQEVRKKNWGLYMKYIYEYMKCSVTTGECIVWLQWDRNGSLGQLQCSTCHYSVSPNLLPTLHGRTGHTPQSGNVS